MPSVSGSWEVCDVSASIICSSCMRSSSTAYSMPMCSTSTEPGRIKASSSRFRSRKLSQCHQITQVARSSPSRSWAGYIMTIAEVHEFFQRRLNCKRPTQSASPMFITRHILVIFGAPWNTQGRWMLSGTGGSGCKNKDILPILTSCDFQGSHDQIIEEVTCIFLAGYHK